MQQQEETSSGFREKDSTVKDDLIGCGICKKGKIVPSRFMWQPGDVQKFNDLGAAINRVGASSGDVWRTRQQKNVILLLLFVGQVHYS